MRAKIKNKNGTAEFTNEEEPSRYEVRPDPKDISFSDGGPKAWFVAVRKSAG